ncbi:MAG: glycosyltransferase family 4 protein [candidate division Zixibacteria bacterium]|nr:glycosyltransferase family 4 protein [candidate division Zixibacteria bacterium]
MNIAFLNSIEKETFGGMEEWIRLVSTGLIDRGHEITLIGRKESEYLRRISQAEDRVRIEPLDISGDFNPATIVRVRNIIEARRIDLLSVNFNKDIRLGGLAARWVGSIPVVWSVGMNITKDKAIHRWLTPKLVDRAIVPSASLKSEITRFGYIEPAIVDVIPIGIAHREFRRPDPESRRVLREKYNLPQEATVAVTVGRFVYKKAHEFLIDAAPEIIAQHPEIFFLFVGDGVKRDEYRQQINRLGLERHFILTGMLDSIDTELAGADLMIHPAKDEPFGIAILEGMRAGLPVVAGQVGGIPEVVAEGETALLCEPCNSVALAQSVNEFLDDRPRMERFGRKGQRRCREQFQLDTMIDNVEQAFTRLIAAGPGLMTTGRNPGRGRNPVKEYQ